jgi:hypothetical protein
MIPQGPLLTLHLTLYTGTNFELYTHFHLTLPTGTNFELYTHFTTSTQTALIALFIVSQTEIHSKYKLSAKKSRKISPYLHVNTNTPLYFYIQLIQVITLCQTYQTPSKTITGNMVGPTREASRNFPMHQSNTPAYIGFTLMA